MMNTTWTLIILNFAITGFSTLADCEKAKQEAGTGRAFAQDTCVRTPAMGSVIGAGR